MQSLKKNINLSLEANDFDAFVVLATDKPRVVGLLVRISYDKETLVGWRAIKAVGLTRGTWKFGLDRARLV